MDMFQPADIAAAFALLISLRKTKAALDAFRALAESSADTLLLSHFQCLEQDIMEAKRAAVNTAGPGGMNALHVACAQGNAADVEYLLGFGADPTAEGWAGLICNMKVFPLYIACVGGSKGDAGAVVKMLLSHAGVDVNQGTTDDVATVHPLYSACSFGRTEVVKMLLARDEIEVNQARTDDGSTPLFIACFKGNTGIVAMLLARDAIDVNQARTDTGGTPLWTACYHGHTEIVTMLLARDEIDVNQARTDDGVTPLHIACDHGNTAVVKMLLARNGIEVDKVANDGMTPLHSAVLNGHFALAQLLAVYGASFTAVDNLGDTAAAIATSEGQPVLAEWLTAVAGWSQLRIAAGCRLHKDAALLLRQGRTDPDDHAATSIQDMMQVVATSLAKPAALPWQTAPPICKATATLVADATRGWHRRTHWLHHKAVRDAVFAVVVVAGRLQAKDAPLLPIEIWLFAMRFFQRSWWEVQMRSNEW